MTSPSMCKSIGCTNPVTPHLSVDFCQHCLTKTTGGQPLSARYPQQYRSLGDMTEIDVFAINQLFKVQDPSGCLQFAIGKLLTASSRPTAYADILEARDTLTRWLQLNQEIPA